MNENNLKDEAIVLARKDYKEADKIVTLLTRNHGKIVVLAKGVKKLSSKKRGTLEPFQKIKISLNSNSDKYMPIITESVNIETYPQIRGDLKKVAVAYYLSELTAKLTQEWQENRQIYQLLSRSLEKLNQNISTKAVKDYYSVNSLSILGFTLESQNLTPEQVDKELEVVLERSLGSKRIGKKLLS